MDKYCDTRFGTAVIMCETLKSNKEALKKTVVSHAFRKWSANKSKPGENTPSLLANTKGAGLSHYQLGKLTTENVNAKTFWRDLDDFLTVIAEPYKATPA